MRLPSVPSIVRTLLTVSNATTTTLLRHALSPQHSLSGVANRTSGISIALLRAPPMPIPLLSSLFGSSTSQQQKMTYPNDKTKDEWKAILSPEQFRILREKGTEAPYTGKYDQHYPSPSGAGVYKCAGCEAPLYTARHKFKSGCGWPAFFDAVPGAVTRHEDRSFGMARIEIVCSSCGGHLGHVFKGEGYATPTDERHCVNSVSIVFGEDGTGAGGEGKA